MSLNKIKINNTTTVNTGVVYDITKATSQSYDSLSAALGTNGNNVPPEIREGGMSVRFVSNSDNKYVQYRLMAQNFTTNTTRWQGVDDLPTANSDNLVKSGGVAIEFFEIKGGTVNNTAFDQIGAAVYNGTFNDNPEFKHTDYIKFDTSKSIKVQGYDSASMIRIANFYDENKQFLGYWSSGTSPFSFDEFTIQPSAYPSGTKYVIVNTYYSNLENSHVIYNVKGTIEDLQEHIEEIELNPVVIEDNPLTNHTEIKAKGNVLGVVPSLKEFAELSGGSYVETSFPIVGAVLWDGSYSPTAQDFHCTNFIEINPEKEVIAKGYDSASMIRIANFYDENKQFLGYWSSGTSPFSFDEFTIQPNEIPAGTRYIRINTYDTVISSSYVKCTKQGSVEKIEEAIRPLVVSDEQICIPSKLYAVVGTEFNLYKDAVVIGQDKGLQSPANINVEIRCDVGNDYERMYSITPQASDIGTHALIINIYSGNKEFIASKSCSLVVIDNIAPSSQKNYLAIGDSTLANGNVTTYLIDKFQSNKPNTFGTNTKQLPLKNQGVGGWGIVNFTERGSVDNMYATDYKLYTIDVADTIDVKTGSVYEDSNGNRISPSLVYSNKIQFVLSGNFNTLSSPLSLVSGGGKQSIEFTSKYTQYGNPFWNPSNNELDLDYYKSNIGFVGSFDIVSIRLGINDSLFKNIHNTADFNVTIQRLKDLVDLFIDDGAKIIVELPTCDVSDEDAWGVNEGAGRTNSLGKYAYQKDLFKLRAAIISIFDNEAYNSNVEVGCAGLCVDRWYGYPASGNIQEYTGKVASVFNITEVIHNNFVHPNEDGYKQLAYAIYPQLLHLINA